MAILITDVELVSTDSFGGQGNNFSWYESWMGGFYPFSSDGSQISFYSSASNFVSGDTNGVIDVFIKNITTGALIRVSTDSVGTQVNGNSWHPAFSPDGTNIAFYSEATNLVSGDTNGWGDVFVKNLSTGAVTRISTDSAGIQANSASDVPEFSPDGTKIVFESHATNLVAGDTNGSWDVFVKDLISNSTVRISTGSGGEQGNANSWNAVFSPDGTKVVFESFASNLVENDTNGVADIFIKNLVSGQLLRISTDSFGNQGDNHSENPSFSPDGTKILFSSTASNLVIGDTNGERDVFVKDLITGAISRVSTDGAGLEGNGLSWHPAFSPDGSKVAFESYSSNLVSDDTNGVADIFMKDLATGEVTKISHDVFGTQTNNASYLPAFSPDGSGIIFVSNASNLISGDVNSKQDIFIAHTNIPAGIYGTGLADTINGTDEDNIIHGWQGADTLNGGLGNDFMFGGVDNDLIHGDGGDDKLRGDDGIDTIFGDAGNDDVRGGTGNDLIFGGADNDQLKGNEGNDTIYGDDSNDELYGESGSDDLYGGAGNDKLSGGDDVDRLNGGDGTDKLYGGMGNDQLKGDAGNDSLSGDDGNDKLWGSFGDDTLNGGNGTDELYGDDGNDKLFGGAGVDKLSGGTGNDKLTGGDGSDNLWGGAGSDQFVFDAASLSAQDIVKDFSSAQGDKLELYNILTGYDPLTSAISDFVKITESSGKSYLSVDANGSTDGALFIQIAQIDNTVGITNVGQLLTDHVLIVTNSIVV